MACGLPIISSDLPFNHGILDEQVSIMVDPRDVKALELAITELVDSRERRESMGRAARQKSASFRLSERARGIVEFMESLC
jgi:glycosyltransferase involved in cell wall biosynthesis